jgi:hypothetical protein
LYRDAPTRSGVAVDFQPHRWAGDLLIRRHVAQQRDSLQLAQFPRSSGISGRRR